nr:PIN domain-containing protein [Haladaptatus sp. R4]
MRLFLDTNILISAIVSEPGRGHAATKLLNEDHEFLTCLLNIMELRTVLCKKK